MELTEMVKIIRELFPEKAVELSESLGLLSDALEDTRQVIKDKMIILFDQGRHEAMVPHNQLAAALLEYIAKVQEVQSELASEDRTQESALSILEKVKDTFKDCAIGTVLTRQEIVDKVVLKYGCNPSSIIPSDYCYNRLNNGIDFRNYLHIFEYRDRSSYKYLGVNYPYNGKIYHNPKSGPEIVVGEWVNGTIKIN